MTAQESFRCAVASQALQEPLEGTASTVRAFVLLEAAGPWGVEAVRDCRIDTEVKQRLLDLERRHRVRPLLIRRHGRAVGGATRVYAVYAGGHRTWTETAVVADVRDLLDVDLTGLADGTTSGLAPHPDPLFLVCTHGRHDACCAERGRPLAAALTAVAPESVWEVSHIGGDRFAGNVLVLPHGLYYGRLAPEEAPAFVAAHLAGHLDLEHLRGRSSYSFPVQAAEVHLRRHLGITQIAPLRLVEAGRDGAVSRSVFVADGRRWEVRVHSERGEPRQLTCRAAGPSAGLTHRLVGITAL